MRRSSLGAGMENTDAGDLCRLLCFRGDRTGDRSKRQRDDES